MIPDKKMVEKIKGYDRNLFVEWDVDRERFAIKRRADDGSVHHCFFVQNDDGSFRPLDERIMNELYESDIWRHFKDSKDYHKFLQDRNKEVDLKAETLRKEYIMWWNKEHKAEWSAAIDNAGKGNV